MTVCQILLNTSSFLLENINKEIYCKNFSKSKKKIINFTIGGGGSLPTRINKGNK